MLPLHSSLTSQAQRAVFKLTDKTKIVVATNIAETSITIEEVTLAQGDTVILCCQWLSFAIIPYSGIYILILLPLLSFSVKMTVSSLC